ncbi:MAG: biotin/lipoyl-binding protein [Dermatophilus congolensis]|nr:biotin/lipoyl-binding protein [Dermatophilus congolensis]
MLTPPTPSGDPMPRDVEPFRPRSKRRPVAVAVTGALALTTLVAGGYLLLDRQDPPTGPLQTAPVSRADIDQTVDMTGAVKRLSSTLVTPTAPGKVESVRVKVGDKVRAGQVLATMDSAAAKQALTKAQANVVRARAGAQPVAPRGSAAGAGELKNAQQAADSARGAVKAAAGARERARVACSSLADSAGIDPARPMPAPAPPRAPAEPKRTPEARRTADATPAPAARSTGNATDRASKAPAPAEPAKSAGSSGSTESATKSTEKQTEKASAKAAAAATPGAAPRRDAAPSSTPEEAAPPQDSGTPTDVAVEPMSFTRPLPAGAPIPAQPAQPSDRQVQACVDALAVAMASDRSASSSLDDLSVELGRASTQMQRMSATADQAALAARAGSNASLAALVKAEAELAMAQQAVNGGTLVAGMDGEVTSVGLEKGKPAMPGQGINVAGKGAAELIVNVPLARVGLLRVGQPATVTGPGGGKALAARISAIETTPSDSGSVAPLYPVHVTVSDAPTSLGTGTIATAKIRVASVDGVKSVPVSAMSGFTGGKGTVQVLENGTATERSVGVGAVGQGRAEITSGLDYGEVVVIADPAAQLPNETMKELNIPKPSISK